MILGMSISNFGTDLKFGGEDLRRSIAARPDIWGANQNIPAEFQTGSYPLPLIFRVGIAMDIWRTNIQKLTLAIDGLHPNNTSEYVNIGGEYIFSAFRKTSEFAIRGGYNSLFMKDSQQGLTLGGGMSFYISENFSLEIDYAFADYEYFGSVHRYSVGLKF